MLMTFQKLSPLYACNNYCTLVNLIFAGWIGLINLKKSCCLHVMPGTRYLTASSSSRTLVDLNSFSSLIYFVLLFDILLSPLDNLWAALYKSEFVFVFVAPPPEATQSLLPSQPWHAIICALICNSTMRYLGVYLVQCRWFWCSLDVANAGFIA